MCLIVLSLLLCLLYSWFFFSLAFSLSSAFVLSFPLSLPPSFPLSLPFFMSFCPLSLLWDVVPEVRAGTVDSHAWGAQPFPPVVWPCRVPGSPALVGYQYTLLTNKIVYKTDFSKRTVFISPNVWDTCASLGSPIQKVALHLDGKDAR